MQILLATLFALAVPAIPSDWSAWRTESLAPGVHVFVAPPGTTPLVCGNTLVVVGEESVLVVDTGQLPSIARLQIKAVKQLTKLPVKWIVNTHWHGDHWVANGEWLAAYPGATIVATEKTRQLMEQKGTAFMTTGYTKTTIAEVQQLLTGPKAPPPGSQERAYYELGIKQLEQFEGELRQLKITFPTLTFEERLTIDLGKRRVDVRFLGRGNTGGDLIVHLPDEKIVATGDLVVAPYPYAIGSHIHEWQETLRKLIALDAKLWVPGHGAVLRDTRYLDLVKGALGELETQVRAAVNRGEKLEQIRKTVRLAAFRARFCGDDPWCGSAYDSIFVDSAVGRAFREATAGALADED